MTLDTRVYVIDHVDLAELFVKCQSLLTAYDEKHRTPDQQRTKAYPESMDNEGGQGLPAWLMVHHGGERPYRTAQQIADHDEDCNLPSSKYYDADEPECDGTIGYVHRRQPCWYEVSYDTAYGYKGPDGMGCGDLHARLVAELGMWLDTKGVRWKWKNEFTGEVHEGYDRLTELGSSGFEASAWYRTSALPAIIARAAKEGPA